MPSEIEALQIELARYREALEWLAEHGGVFVVHLAGKTLTCRYAAYSGQGYHYGAEAVDAVLAAKQAHAAASKPRVRTKE